MRHRAAIRPIPPVGSRTSPATATPHGGSYAEDPVRTIELIPGVVWRVRVVARLVSEDVVLGTHSACLIVRLERPGVEGARDLLATLRADSLEEVPEAQLHALVSRYGSPRRAAAR